MEIRFARVGRGFFSQVDRDKPSCWTCIHGKFNQGCYGNLYQPPEPDYVECKIDWRNLDAGKYDELDNNGWNEETSHAICGKYYSRMIVGVCPCGCGHEINAPEVGYEYLAGIHDGDPVPVATLECLQRMKDRYHGELMKDLE